MDPPDRDAARERLATLQACRLLWGTGAFVAPEAVALDALDRRGRAGDDAPAVTAARRLARALSAPERGGSFDDVAGEGALRGAPALVAAAPVAASASEADRLDAAAARLVTAAAAGRGGAVFAPVPLRRRIGGPSPEARLAAWRARADEVAAAMKGATPARMVALLARRPAVCAPAAASALGLSDDAALRVLTRLERERLAREMTGQGRFRVWAAAM
jgi:hypothetical protein